MNRPRTFLCALALALGVCGRGALARQEAGGGGAQAAEEVVRVNAELVQTGVSVFDRQGRFVDGLKREDFELRVDGRPVPITFFEKSVDRRFERGSRLRFMAFVYNAGPAPDLTARVQVYREGREVFATPYQRVATAARTDAARVPFTPEIGLKDLRPGRHTLRVTVEDRAAQRTASQQTAFHVR